MRAERVAAVLGLLFLPCCTVALDFGPGVLLPSLDAGVLDAAGGTDSQADAATDAPGADARCDGRCVCSPGRGDCDGDPANGCEVDLLVTDLHCGTCGQACTGTTRCSVGLCRGGGCRAPQVACGMRCADLLTDSRHCGSCGASCGADAAVLQRRVRHAVPLRSDG
nr:hypothetical protein [Deltaproteobacteria bacterium]